MATTKHRLSEAERAKRSQQQRDRLRQAAQQLLTSEGWQRWVRVRSHAGLARLSISNQLLVALARPDAAFVAGFKTWLRLGYAVRKGERGIAIIAPLPITQRDRLSDEETRETITLFKTVFVFDRQQVAPVDGAEPAPLEPPSQPLTGDSHAHRLASMQAFIATLEYRVSFEAIDGRACGWCDTRARRIVIDADAPANAQLRTLVHEAIHALGIDYRRYSRPQAEVIVDTTTLLGGVGLDVSGETVPYVAGWGEDGALDAITEFAQLIDNLARRVQDALIPHGAVDIDPVGAVAQ